MKIEEFFSPKLRIKILKLIKDLGQLNVSDIAHRLNSNYTATFEHLKLLEAEGILQESTYGRVHMYRYNEASAKAKALENLIEAWEQNK